MTHPIGYYTGYDPKTQEPVILDKLQERFGSQLQRMTYEQKIRPLAKVVAGVLWGLNKSDR